MQRDQFAVICDREIVMEEWESAWRQQGRLNGAYSD
jgi:hypothetical protein